MAESTKGIGLMIRCMVMALLAGLMGSPIKDSIFRIRSREEVGLVMAMAPTIRGIGIKASSMAEASLGIEITKCIKALMRMVSQNSESL